MCGLSLLLCFHLLDKRVTQTYLTSESLGPNHIDSPINQRVGYILKSDYVCSYNFGILCNAYECVSGVSSFILRGTVFQAWSTEMDKHITKSVVLESVFLYGLREQTKAGGVCEVNSEDRRRLP